MKQFGWGLFWLGEALLNLYLWNTQGHYFSVGVALVSSVVAVMCLGSVLLKVLKGEL